MPSYTGTIFELLTAQNPPLDLSRQRYGPVTQSRLYIELMPTDITLWEDFTASNIYSMYGHLLGAGPFDSDAIFLRGSPSRVENEHHVDLVSSAWCVQMCRMPIKYSASVIQEDLKLGTHDVSFRPQAKHSHDLGTDGRARMPDWGILLNDRPETVLVWGDSKCSSKWKANRRECPEENWIWPFRQIATYCVNNNTRYGFILTPEEIVAVRLYRSQEQQNMPWRLQYQSVPWNNQGPNVLTVNLTIWALALMGVNEHHRSIQQQEWTIPLNVWYKEIEPRNRSVSYHHHLSGRILTSAPQGSIIGPRPQAGSNVQQVQQSQDASSARRSSRLSRR